MGAVQVHHSRMSWSSCSSRDYPARESAAFLGSSTFSITTMPAQPDRRQLNFQSLDDAVADARQLLATGYRATGNWNLAQTLEHCGDWLSFPLDGYPAAAFPVSAALWLMKHTVGKAACRRILRERRFKPGSPTLPVTVKRADEVQEAVAVERLAALVQRFHAAREPLHASPLFGALTKQQHEQLQIIHLQHHLSLLIPNAAA